jgi:hypothetical protein
MNMQPAGVAHHQAGSLERVADCGVTGPRRRFRPEYRANGVNGKDDPATLATLDA